MGFSALPVGFKDKRYFYNDSFDAYFWSAAENDTHDANLMNLSTLLEFASLYDYDKNHGYSVRCLKD